MPGLLVFSRDPGPTNQLIAVVEALRRAEPSTEPAGLMLLRKAAGSLMDALVIIARPPGDAIWRASGYAPRRWSGKADVEAGELIDRTGARLILTGTNDIDEPADRALWRAARARGVESHVVLDHPANLAERFSDRDARKTYPDWLYVADEIFASRLIAVGAPADRVRIIGDLHHARLARLAQNCSRKDIADLRASWGAGQRDVVMLFASECAQEMAARGRPSAYDEVDVLLRLLVALHNGEHPGGGRIDPTDVFVVVRPHPRDEPRKYAAAVEGHRGQPRVIVSDTGAPETVLRAADLVVGMNSSLLYEARVLGRPALSLVGRDLSAGKSAAS